MTADLCAWWPLGLSLRHLEPGPEVDLPPAGQGRLGASVSVFLKKLFVDDVSRSSRHPTLHFSSISNPIHPRKRVQKGP